METHVDSLDTLIAPVFYFCTLTIFTFLTYATINLGRQGDARALFNCLVTRGQIASIFLLMQIGVFWFTYHHMLYSAFSIFLMAIVCCYAMDRLSRRARILLVRYGYL